MEIASLYFLIIVLSTAIVYYLINHKNQILFLTLISCVFIVTFSFHLLYYILLYSLLNFLIGLLLNKYSFKKSLFRIGVFLNISQLIVLNYADFTLNPLFSLVNLNYDFSFFERFIVPVGVSYFTLQGIGYLVNVKMGWEKAETNVFKFVLYLIFFPKFLSGPIERSNHFLPQLNFKKQFLRNEVTLGLRLVLFGIFKKVVIANQLAPFVNRGWTNLESLDGPFLMILFILQPIYLYFDFSGYTDMAIGLARIYGISLLPNFNRPFLSENVTMFWKRFHMTLASWFNDYIFRQLVFKYRRWGINSSIFALLLTWILFGIWHGAGWNFMILGLLQAIAIIYEFFTKKWRVSIFPDISGFYRVCFNRVLTYLFYCVSLVFFFAPNNNAVIEFFSKMVNNGDLPTGFFYREEAKYFLISMIFVILILVFEFIQNDFENLYRRIAKFWWSDLQIAKWTRRTVYYFVIILIILTSNKVESFVYIQF